MAVSAGNPRIAVLAPSNGTNVAPGQTVTVTVQVDQTVLPGAVIVWAGSGQSLVAKVLNGPPFEGTITIPVAAAGPFQIAIALSRPKSDGVIAFSDGITLNVIPADVPLSIKATDVVYLTHPTNLNPLDLQLRVFGTYPGNVEREITSIGTTYRSLNPEVVTVDASGQLASVGPGFGFISVENRGATAYTKVVVHDATGLSFPPIDRTSSVSITSSGFQHDPETDTFVQNLTILNAGGTPLPKALYLVISGLPKGITLANSLGLTKRASPVGSPMAVVKVDESHFLSPGKTATATLKFRNYDRLPITYSAKLYCGTRP
jgi:hypothetical protein